MRAVCRVQMMKSFYHTGGTMDWNGHFVEGQEAIAQFLQRLPVSETRIESVDVHPVRTPPFHSSPLNPQYAFPLFCCTSFINTFHFRPIHAHTHSLADLFARMLTLYHPMLVTCRIDSILLIFHLR